MVRSRVLVGTSIGATTVRDGAAGIFTDLRLLGTGNRQQGTGDRKDFGWEGEIVAGFPGPTNGSEAPPLGALVLGGV